ncbi:undecaprenyldiphospho-muramoylpentapeptide beta-N-acetylglucosaminyltransferase [Robiginitalea sp. SC105]|uniref:undecaprenyldiphospho-muramoylpentapeptide beta-N-acetylglucosaminyltransferase n=1 Tax=Robiginitalea sp. SC105 TaxID=2762332 RepID=UPI00163AA7D1|nr:undecaprenyldiphospho-muramoylpentapeptide beta-N-acetylglucosaminyltransferase [Robiginitalea sp. SC105]
MDSYRFLLSGGGTGGHIYPAIAIANELKSRHPDARFLFVGAKDRMEMEKVPQAGYEIRGLWISGLARKLSWKNLLFPLKLIKSMMQARKIIREFKPDLVIGTGGFASGPTLRVAAGRGIPCVLQEQNSYAGITNKLLARKARKIFVAYEGMERFFPQESIVFTGNPVRGSLAGDLPDPARSREQFGLEPGGRTLLVLGGSQGARRINELIAAERDFLLGQGLQIIWQCGKGYYETYRAFDSDGIRVRAFIPDMETAYAAADIIISRAGAGSVSELCLIGKPVVFIPSPNVAEDHQTKNARAMVAHDAAVMLTESELETGFQPCIEGLLSDPGRMSRLGSNLRRQGRPEATRQIADEIEKILNP